MTVTLAAGTVLLGLSPDQLRRRATKLEACGENRHRATELVQFKKGELLTMPEAPLDKRLQELLEPAGTIATVGAAADAAVTEAKKAASKAREATRKLFG
jgi:hypothetical protein